MTETETVTYYMGANGLKYATPEMANESIKRQQQQLLQEVDIPTQNSLRDASKTKPNTTAEADTLARFMHLNSEQKRRHLEQIQKNMGLDPHTDGDGVGNVAAGNRASLKPGNHKMPKLNQTVAQALQAREEAEQRIKETFGVDDDDLQKFADFFEARVADAAVTRRLAELFTGDDKIFTLLFEPNQIPVAEQLAQEIETLEENISALEQEQEWYLQQADMHRPALSEEVLYGNGRPASHHRRSSNALNASLYDTDPDNSVLTEDGGSSRSDPMRRYTEAIARSTAHRNIESPVKNLMEAWRNNQN